MTVSVIAPAPVWVEFFLRRIRWGLKNGAFLSLWQCNDYLRYPDAMSVCLLPRKVKLGSVQEKKEKKKDLTILIEYFLSQTWVAYNPSQNSIHSIKEKKTRCTRRAQFLEHGHSWQDLLTLSGSEFLSIQLINAWMLLEVLSKSTSQQNHPIKNEVGSHGPAIFPEQFFEQFLEQKWRGLENRHLSILGTKNSILHGWSDRCAVGLVFSLTWRWAG